MSNMILRSDSRGGHKVRALAVHTTEGILKAADLLNWAEWPGSSHASADADGALLTPADGFVPYDLAAWTIRAGNPWTENIELCGFANWTRKQWLAKPKLLDACAKWLAARAAARGIPLVKLSPVEYRAGRAGVIGHKDHTIGYSDGSHTDPGDNFPYDVVLAKAATYSNVSEDDVMATLDEVRQVVREELDKDHDEIAQRVRVIMRDVDPAHSVGHIVSVLDEVKAQLAELTAAPAPSA